jgi:hypothetical protein
VLCALRFDTVLCVTRYVAIFAPGLTILFSLLNYHITTYCVTLRYTTDGHKKKLQQSFCQHLTMPAGIDVRDRPVNTDVTEEEYIGEPIAGVDKEFLYAC